jgi:acyl-CoA synthetase (NDP forming)
MRMDTIDRMFDTAMLLAYQPVPQSNRVAIVTNAGGPGIMASDACSHHNLELVDLADETIAKLRSFLPAEASLRNPVDMLASAGPAEYEQAVRAVLADDNVDSLMVLFVPPIMIEATGVAHAIRRGAEGSHKTIATTFMGSHGVPEALSSLRAGELPSYAFPESAAIAIARAVAYGEWLEQPAGTIPDISDIDAAAARQVVEYRVANPNNGDDNWLAPNEVCTVLEAYGLRGPQSAMATTADAAVASARDIGYPVALKLVSPTITHKSDVGGVALWLHSDKQVREAFHELEQNLDARGQRSEMEGALVQEMAREGIETFIGATYDAKFGPLMAFGIGGIHVEVWRDVVFRVHPLTDLDAREMLDNIRGKKLLDGVRGEPAADREALVSALLRVSQMISDLPEIVEIDMNPLFALAPGKGVLAVDTRIRVRSV